VTCEPAASSPVSASSTSGCTAPASTTPSSARPIRGDAASSNSAGPESPSTTTSERLIALRLASIFSSEASPAEEQAPPATEREWEIQRLLCGGSLPVASASFDPDSSSWRTSRISLLSSEGQLGERFSGTWPRSGMCSLGTVFPLPPLAPRTSATGSSSLLPTPVSQDGKNATAPSQADRNSPPLTHALLPTPAKADGQRASESYGRGNPTLKGSLLPTPTATAYGFNQSPSEGAAVRPSLESLATRLLPTFTGASYQQGGTAAESTAYKRILGEIPPTGAATPEQSPDGKKSPAPLLNPSFVAWMLGMPAEWSDPACPLTATEFSSRLGFSSGADSSPSREAA
jgi:hypothetical protein